MTVLSPMISTDIHVVKGSYILIIKMAREQTIITGGLGSIAFNSGYYAYVGSAMNGLKPRLDRHLNKNKRNHWHIDYLLSKAAITKIIIAGSETSIECQITQMLNRYYPAVNGFGSSDCRCPGHLFFADNAKQIITTVMSSIERLGIHPEELKP